MAKKQDYLKRTFRINRSQLKRLQDIGQETGTSMSAVLRAAIDAYDPHGPKNIADEELRELVSMFIKTAIIDLRNARERFEKTLDELNTKHS